jgi:endogenous inhibitor of DNA gyrase (YacG/DUF329 family)
MGASSRVRWHEEEIIFFCCVTQCSLVDVYDFLEQLAAVIFREEDSLHFKQWQYFLRHIDKHLPST